MAATHPRHSARRQRSHFFNFAAIVLGLLASGAVVLTASQAAFSDTTSNDTNTFSTGNVDLVDDDSGSAMFSVTDMAPGQSVSRCIVVTYQGSIADPNAVKLYSGGLTDSGTLADHLNVTVEEGSGGTFADCTGFTPSGTIENGTLAQFAADHTNYGNGAGSWNPATTPVSRTDRFTVTLSAAAPNSQQSQSVTNLVFTWEVQS